MRLLRRLTLALCMLALPAALLAETIYMRDGRVLTGRITNQSRTDITLATAQGVLTIQKDQIRRIQYDNPQQDAQKAEEARRLEEARREQERKLQEERLKEYERQQQLQRQQNEQRLQQEEKKRRDEEEAKKRLELEKKPDKKPDDKPLNDWKKREEERMRKLKEFEERARLLGPTWYGALARNMVFPGWGEVYQGRQTRGLLLAGSFAALTTFTLYEAERYRKNYTNYADTTGGFIVGTPIFVRNVFSYSLSDAQGISWLILGSEQTKRARDRMQLHAARLRYAKAGMVALYAFGIADVLLFKPASQAKVGLGSDGQDLHLAFTAAF